VSDLRDPEAHLWRGYPNMPGVCLTSRTLPASWAVTRALQEFIARRDFQHAARHTDVRLDRR
jgi:hypothetical protein